MTDIRSGSLVVRANNVFRLATSRPADGRHHAELIAAEAGSSTEPGAPEARVIALRAASWAARELFDHEAAYRLIDEAISVATRHSLQHRLGECYLTRSSIHLESGLQKLAQADLDQAASIAPPQTGAEIAVAMGVIEQKAGMYVAALHSYDRALGLASTSQHDVRFKALSNGAICASRLGRHTQARRMIDDAIVVAEGHSAVYVAHAAHNRALLTAERGSPSAALDFFDLALDLWERADLLPAEHYLEKAETFLALRLLEEAEAAVASALGELSGRSGAALLYAEGLLLAAVIAGNSGNAERAVELNEQAASVFDSQDRRGWWAVAAQAAISARLDHGAASNDDRSRLGEAEAELTRAGHTSAQISAALTSARLARSSGDHSAAGLAYQRCAAIGKRGSALQRIQGWAATAELADMEGDGRRVSSAALAGLRTLDDHRATFDAIELRARAATYGEALAAHGLKWAVTTGRPQQVWFWLERTRAAALVEPGWGHDADEQTEEALGHLRAAAAAVAGLEPGAADRAKAEDDLANAEHAVRAISWRRNRTDVNGAATDADPALGRSPTHATLQRIRADLGQTGIVQYGVVQGELIAVAITTSRRVIVPLCQFSDVAAAMRQTAFGLRRLGRVQSAESGQKAIDTTNAVIDRLDHHLTSARMRNVLEDCDELVVVPPSDMIGVPWASLPTFSDRRVMVTPSATAWWVSTNRRPTSEGRPVAFAGPGLPHAADEAKSVAEAYVNADAFVEAEANSTMFAERVSGAGTVHVAAHGRLRRDSPTFSSFELADGPFTVHDIQRIPAPPQRWILAACDLGSPGNLSGTDLEGIVAALFCAGAGAIVAAVVPVPDSTSPKLMAALHHQLAGGASTAKALRQARNELNPRDPFERLAQIAFTCFGAA